MNKFKLIWINTTKCNELQWQNIDDHNAVIEISDIMDGIKVVNSLATKFDLELMPTAIDITEFPIVRFYWFTKDKTGNEHTFLISNDNL